MAVFFNAAYTRHYSTKNPTMGRYPLLDSELQTIYASDPNIALFKSRDTSAEFASSRVVIRDESETDTSSETDENIIPEPLTR